MLWTLAVIDDETMSADFGGMLSILTLAQPKFPKPLT
jgi:hypothetical protein